MNPILLTIVTAVITVVATNILHWPSQLRRYIQKWITPDHAALYSAEWGLLPSPSSDTRVRVTVAVAPNRSLKQSEFNPGAAISFVHSKFPGQFPREPKFSNVSTGIQFVRPGNSIENGYLWVWKSGRLDFQECVKIQFLDDGTYILNLKDLSEPIVRMVAAINSAEYWAIYKTRLYKRPRRFDWYISVSTGIVLEDGVTVSKSDIQFPGRRPDRASGHNQTICPAGGYAQDELRNWNPKTGTISVLRPFLNDFLQQNGFYDCEETLEDLLN